MKYALYKMMFALRGLFCSCEQEARELDLEKTRSDYRVERIGRLDKAVNESSGLLVDSDGALWSMNDSGGKPVLYQLNQKGKLLDSARVIGAKNVDWEALAWEGESILIGDFGNNWNARRDLVIYRYRSENSLARIDFYLADQDSFPPPMQERNFDLESLWSSGGKYYMLSKNRGKGPIKLYELDPRMHSRPASAQVVQTLPIENVSITDAALNPAGDTLAVLGYFRLWLLPWKDGRIQPGGEAIRLCGKNQTEGVAFGPDGAIYLTNEQRVIRRITRK